MCRGNNRSAWHAEGSYEPIAEKAFNRLNVDRFLLEYDTDRAGGFEPLRFVPEDKMVVLGLDQQQGASTRVDRPTQASRGRSLALRAAGAARHHAAMRLRLHCPGKLPHLGRAA